MRQAQAQKKAQQLWGDKAMIERRKKGAYKNGACTACWTKNCTDRRQAYSVGRTTMGLFFEVRGSGHSWDEAFADAEKRS